jgi:hypothetical protein
VIDNKDFESPNTIKKFDNRFSILNFERNYSFMARHEPLHHKLLVFIFQLCIMVVSQIIEYINPSILERKIVVIIIIII